MIKLKVSNKEFNSVMLSLAKAKRELMRLEKRTKKGLM